MLLPDSIVDVKKGIASWSMFDNTVRSIRESLSLIIITHKLYPFREFTTAENKHE